ncbi:MAG TPA: LysR substrate-binding domain-containing protein [Steroidobacteraceae bacterium]|nr:LysR substrate-binding domain-containing protein [Steroidobacteraceae bacterium]
MIDLKLKDLRYLVAVADERHFGHAAAKCFVSQPTLSAQLRKLEDALGVQLVERRPRQVTLTEAGEEIAERARSMLQSGEAIVSLAQARRDPLAGSLRIGLLPTVGPYLLPLVALKLRRALPRLELLLYEYQTAPMLERLAAGELDLGILALPVPAENLMVRELYREPFVLALPEPHALAARARVRVEDLAGETLLLLEDGHCLREQALALCSRSGGREKQDFRATSIETLRQMVAAGAGVTLLPALATRGAYASARGVALRAFVRPEPSRLIGAVWRRSSARGAAIAAVCDEIVRHCGLPAAAATAPAPRTRSAGG